MATSGDRSDTSATARRSPTTIVGDAATSALGGDWPDTAANTIVKYVDQAREKTTGPAITISRAIVYGLLAAILGLIAFVLFIIGIVRFTNAYLPGGVWSAYLLLGILFGIVGAVLWTKRP